MKYRLPCQRCGRALLIDVSQAGQQVGCDCGEALEVPSLRAIRALEPAAEVQATSRRRSWDRGRGLLFAAGVVLAVLGSLIAGAAATGWLASSPPLSPTPQDIEAAVAVVDGLTAPQAWDLWSEMRSQGLGQYMEPPQSVYQAYLRHVRLVFLVGAVLLAAGIGAAATSLVLPGRAGKR